ncbi:BTAD domain-containing putative transcriptional regulator [Glycomyces algeriensis]|uniref:SARP family transcriptional regulator n=1 Tax=Glycomyces algeriensis TaxID=256037 RepID=A0A9W6G4I3_9ACTN|nr:BTAD domain-containing putative transcriptional regulator [Glycomyces algeriensis]MDA1368380.1 BTAD domain-containing putative transcriptional regulator [Glycomyces algeriensis]MDR7353186.1 putative ATPase/DNA-binding SARP family transcriptional activator [Glycomyces algeriensis]GLI40880.1 SARP family transcriptional regulator [Glycomyces algeriensis]
MRVHLLGSFEIRNGDDEPVELPGARLRALVARLALEPGREVTADTLLDAIWEDDAPSANALQALVSRVRRAIGADRLTRGAAGYRLAVEPGDVDVKRFERLSETGRRQADLTALREAESLWRGAALADLRHLRFAENEAIRLERLRNETTRERLALEITTGADVLAELEPIAAANPLDERWQALLMRALYATGRPAEALDAYERAREHLADELGADPSPELADLHLQILRQSAAPTARAEKRTNLKAQLTSFVGREDDLDALATAVAASRLVTVTGPGGAGKTRLAVEAAATLSNVAPQGIWLVELAAVGDDSDVAPAVLRAIGARESGLLEPSVHDAASRLEEYFADQDALIILDNCEHRIDAAARLAAQLLGACPGLRLLATSREALGIGGERLFPIPPLPVSDDRPEASPAVRLFCERAAAVRPDFKLDATNAEAVVEICRRLDGLPLAVELAAARMRALDASQIASRLDDRFALLAGSDRTAPERHRTLEGVIAWSWELLSDAERALAMRMSVYPGGVGLDRVDDLDALAGLVDKSLVERMGERYRMLETIRTYAEAQLEPDQAEAERDVMAHYCLDLVERADDEIRSATQLEAMAGLDAEHDNILAVLARSVAIGHKETGLRMIAALFWFWHLRGFRTQLQHWYPALLELPGEVPERLVPAVKLLTGMGQFEFGDAEAATRSIAEGIALGRNTNGPIAGHSLLAIAPAFLSDPAVSADRATAEGWELGVILLTEAAFNEGGTGAEGLDQIARAEAEFAKLGERFGLASALRMRAEYSARQGDHDEAKDALAQAGRLFDELGTAADAAETYAELALFTARSGALLGGAEAVAQAWEPMRLSLDRADAERTPSTTAYVRWCRAQILLSAGDREQGLAELAAAEHAIGGTRADSRLQVWGAALRAIVALADGDAALAHRHFDALTAEGIAGAADPNLAVAVRVRAAVTLAEGDAVHAATLLGAALSLLGTEDRRGYDAALRTLARTREALGDNAFEAHYGAGATLDRAAAVELLLANPSQS